LIRAALPFLKAAKGSVLNIGSVNAYSGASNLVPYSISKGGLTTLTRNLADALCGDQVRVNQVNPGWVLTANESKMMTDAGNPPDWWKHPPKHAAPSGELIKPETIAAAAVFWIGDESRPISGSVVELAQFPIIGRNVVIEK
jgi:NAD(P)-dependent dehydrogenase (short-subunit alcohol dehydrogenase family)